MDKLTNIYNMLKLQDKLNLEIDKNIYDLNKDWKSAIIVESGEFIESLSYKWWKKQEPDIENAKVELVDIWHFLMSYYIDMLKKRGYDDEIKYKYLSELIYNSVKKVFTQEYPVEIKLEVVRAKLIESLTSLLTYPTIENTFENYLVEGNDVEPLTKFFELLPLLNFKFDDFVVIYFCKNALNTVRSKNGYKEGTYKKYWNGIEDNKAALDFIMLNREVLGQSLNIDLIVSLLDNFYKNNFA